MWPPRTARPSSVLAELEALLSRIDVYELRPTAEELFAPAVAAPVAVPAAHPAA
jgi:hypothetical protein